APSTHLVVPVPTREGVVAHATVDRERRGEDASQPATFPSRDGVVAVAGVAGGALDRSHPGDVGGSARIEADAVDAQPDRVGDALSGDDEQVRAVAEREIDRDGA